MRWCVEDCGVEGHRIGGCGVGGYRIGVSGVETSCGGCGGGRYRIGVCYVDGCFCERDGVGSCGVSYCVEDCGVEGHSVGTLVLGAIVSVFAVSRTKVSGMWCRMVSCWWLLCRELFW